MKETSVFAPIAFGMVIVAALMTVMFKDHGWVWVPVIGAIVLGGVAAKALR